MKILRRSTPPQPDRQQAILWIYAPTGALWVTTPNGTSAAVGGSGGGGASDHAALSHLGWTVGGHTGTPSRIAYFDSGGSASYLSIGSGLTTSGTSLVVDTGTIATVASVSAGYQPLNSALSAISGGTWTGSTSITTLGTISTGVWNGSAIGVGYGGTGIAVYSTGDLLYASGMSTLSKLGIGAAGYVLGSTGTAPRWRSPSQVQSDLSLVPGTNVQAWDADLDALAALGDGLPYRAAGTWGATALGDLAISGGSVQVTKARGLRDSGGTTRPMGATTAGYPLVLNASGDVTTSDNVSAADVSRSLFHIYFYGGTYAADLGVFTTGGTLSDVTSDTRSGTLFSGVSTAGIYLTALCFQRGMNGKLTLRAVPYASAGTGRFWIGFISTSGPGSGATPTAPFYGISCDPSAGDTQWYATTADGSSIHRTPTGKAYSGTHEYVFEATMTTTGISVRIADTTLGETIESASIITDTTYAPGSGVKFRPYMVGQRVTGTWGIKFVAAYFEANFPNTP